MTDPQKITFGEMREIGVSEPTQQAAYGLLSRLFDQIIFPDQPGGLSAIGFSRSTRATSSRSKVLRADALFPRSYVVLDHAPI